ncbi:hypothetical protein FACS189481_2160 [Clostridia bacterium]|nr:hypothetical protein FACS189481_2160 [Clostridia bacterium]
MKRFVLILVICLFLCAGGAACFVFRNEILKFFNGEQLPEPPKEAEEKPYYETEKNQPINWQASELWEEKLKPLSDTDIPENFNSDKEYILKLARYMQLMSPEGSTRDEQKKLFVIEELEVGYWAKSLLGISDFEYEESPEYNKKTKTYDIAELPSIDPGVRSYENFELEKLPNDRWKFSVDIFELDENGNKIQSAIKASTKEIYIIEGKGDTYKVISVQRVKNEEPKPEDAKQPT